MTHSIEFRSSTYVYRSWEITILVVRGGYRWEADSGVGDTHVGECRGSGTHLAMLSAQKVVDAHYAKIERGGGTQCE